MNFPDTADTKQEEVKESEELKAESVNNADGTDGTKQKSGNVKSNNKQNTDGNFTFCCEQYRTMTIIHFADISNFANINNYI